ncbi:MAG: hypothetical protein OXJ90_29685 [Spirochaetaceae bacterium]|nr:hypothetical protein [Spirochaetaceae bacterium]
MNADSIAIVVAIIAAAIALGTTNLASIRGVRREVSGLRNELRAVEGGLRSDMKAMEDGLRSDMKAMEGRLRDEMHVGFKELTSRVINVGDRLSKVEGIIEGMFWGARNQPADRPGEGAA